MNNIKTYANSYLYSKVPGYEKNILEYVMKAERLNKESEPFSGIIEDVKRRQTSAVLSRVLSRDDVVICTYNKPLPSSFKVFACKDVRSDGKTKVFIDCSGLIMLNNGYYVCHKIDILCTYLLSAMSTLVYNTEPMKILTNSSMIQSGTECFVALSSHIFDYLRVNGYAENRSKISYILAMYFQVNLMGLDRADTSVKNLAAKVAGVQMRDINAMEIYYDDEDLLNIDTLLSSITKTFKTKGMTTDVFVEKWNWFYGTGTHFACELFTAFSNLITNAYSGSYINNQKTIEKCCGRSMVTFTTTMLRIGSDVIDVGFHYESSLDRELFTGTLGRTVVQEVLFNKKITKEMQITIDDLNGGAAALEKKMDYLLTNGYNNKKKASKAAKAIYLSASATTDEYILGKRKGYNNVISTTVKVGNKYFTEKDKASVADQLSRGIVNLSKRVNEENSFDKAETKKVITDLKKSLKIVDPKNAALKESVEEQKEEKETEE